ncbi:MAG: AbrB family transcriptional regulator [Rhodobacteraceae bacterium]|nr:AbrB family transcriptional regulator [Paracoccaceae bacterium]
MNRKVIKNQGITLLLAAIGAGVFVWLSLPMPMLLGPMAICLVAALSGAKLKGMGQVGMFFRTFLGVAVGSTITPDVITRLPEIGTSLMFVPLFVLAIGGIGYPLLRYGFGFNHPTAYFAAMPGGLQDMLIFGEEAGGDVRALGLIHATRVLVILTIAPIVLSLVWQLDLTQPPGVPARLMDPWQIVLMVVAGVVGWKGAEKIGLFGASILGPLILTAMLSLSGIITHRPPAEIIWAAQFFIGIAVGVKYVGITARELRVDVTAGLVFSAAVAGVAGAFIYGIGRSGIAPQLEAFLSFLPGGQAEMTVVAIIAGADLSFVVTHHILRIFVVILFAPVVNRLLNR